jgi:hypothetical protein
MVEIGEGKKWIIIIWIRVSRVDLSMPSPVAGLVINKKQVSLILVTENNHLFMYLDEFTIS